MIKFEYYLFTQFLCRIFVKVITICVHVTFIVTSTSNVRFYQTVKTVKDPLKRENMRAYFLSFDVWDNAVVYVHCRRCQVKISVLCLLCLTNYLYMYGPVWLVSIH